MAEPLAYEGTPLSDYLQEVDIPEHTLQDDPPPPASACTSRPHSSSPAAVNLEVEKLKYALATSAFLSPSLVDALELYPSDVSPVVDAKGKAKPCQWVTWPRNWDKTGQDWHDRDALGNARIVLEELVNSVRRLARGERPIEVAKPILDVVSGRRGASHRERGIATRPALEAAPFKEVESFVRQAQALDRKIEQAMNEMEKTEHSYMMTRSLSTPPSTPARVRAPTDLYAPRRHPLVAHLSRLLGLYQRATQRLSPLLPPSALPVVSPRSTSPPPRSSPLPRLRTRTHQPTASLSELHRHASRAMQERQEVEQWEIGSSVSAEDSPVLPPTPLSPLPATRRSEDLERPGTPPDPFHPTTTYFGGLERKSSTRSNASANSTLTNEQRLSSSLGSNGMRHRLRPSVGAAGVFGIGTSAGGGGGGGASPLLREVKSRRRRPASMGGWIEHSASPRQQSSPSLRYTTGQREGGSGVEPETEEEREEAELRRMWENCHLFRKGFIFNLIAGIEEEGVEDRERWSITSDVVAELSQGLAEVSEGIDKLRQSQAPGRLSSETGSLGQLQSRKSTPVAAVVLTPYTPSPRYRSPLLDFGPPSSAPPPTTQALGEYESSHAVLSHSLRNLQTTLDSVVSEIRLLSPLSAPPSEDPSIAHQTRSRIEQALIAHDSIKEELETLAVEWTKSRINLRRAIGVELKNPPKNASTVENVSVHLAQEDRGGESTTSDELNPEDPPPEEEDVNASLDDGTGDFDLSSRQAILDAALSSSFAPSLEEDAKEKVFEAVAGGARERFGVGEKLSREERVKRMKEAREALDVGKRAAGSVSEQGGGGIGGFEAQQKMVGELREVLRGLGKGREGTD